MARNAIVPYYAPDDTELEMGGGESLAVAQLANSALAQVSPQTLMRLRGALWRGQALRALAPAATEFARAAADGVRVRVSQTRSRVSAGFRVQTHNRGCYRVVVEGEVWVSEA